MLHRNLWENKNHPGFTNKYTKFDQLIIGTIIKILPPNVAFKAKMHQFDSFLASVRLWLCPFVS